MSSMWVGHTLIEGDRRRRTLLPNATQQSQYLRCRSDRKLRHSISPAVALSVNVVWCGIRKMRMYAFVSSHFSVHIHMCMPYPGTLPALNNILRNNYRRIHAACVRDCIVCAERRVVCVCVYSML